MIARLLDRWLRPFEYPMQRSRRRYLAALDKRLPFEATTSGVPDIESVTHKACGLRHLSWEACPAAPARMGVGRVTFG